MPTITVKLDKERAARVSKWARLQNKSKSDVVRSLIDHAGPIVTGDDLANWVTSSEGKGLGLAQRPK